MVRVERMRSVKKIFFSGNEINLQTKTLSLMKIMLNAICETLDMKMRTGTNCDVWVVDFHRYRNKTSFSTNPINFNFKPSKTLYSRFNYRIMLFIIPTCRSQLSINPQINQYGCMNPTSAISCRILNTSSHFRQVSVRRIVLLRQCQILKRQCVSCPDTTTEMSWRNRRNPCGVNGGDGNN